MVDSLLGAGQFHEIGALRRLDNCAAQTVDRVAVFWSAVLGHSSGIGALQVHGSNLQPVNSQRFRFGFVFRGRPIGLLYLIDPAIDVRLRSTTLTGSKIKDDEQRVFPIARGLRQFVLRQAHFRSRFFDRPTFGNFVAHISRHRLRRRSRTAGRLGNRTARSSGYGTFRAAQANERERDYYDECFQHDIDLIARPESTASGLGYRSSDCWDRLRLRRRKQIHSERGELVFTGVIAARHVSQSIAQVYAGRLYQHFSRRISWRQCARDTAHTPGAAQV